MLLVLSSLFGATGGIPSFNRLLVRAAAEYPRRQRLAISALPDAETAAPAEPIGDAVYHPCGGERSRCVTETLRTLASIRPRSFLLGHLNLAPLGALGLPFGVRYGVIAHGTEVWSKLPWHRRLALQNAQLVACVSDDTARRVSQLQGVAQSRCLRIINAVESLPPFESSALPVWPLSGRPLQLLSVTRLHPGEPKGIDLVLRAIAMLPSGSVRYTVIGDGADRLRLRALADGLGLGSSVRFVGAVRDDERDRALSDCDLFVLPSSGEGFGIVYLEAMARGKPCLGARVGGTPEVVLDEQTGLLVTPDVAAVRRALERLFDDELRAKLGQAGYLRVAEHFTYDAFRRHAFALFDELRA